MKNYKQNRFSYGFGTIGRDMVYTLISMYLIFYLTDVIYVKTNVLWWISLIILLCRIFDALNDPIMGLIVDNTHSKYGKFKPWILFGTVTSGIITILLFYNYQLSDGLFILVFAILFLLWGITYTTNDISYWSMLPALSTNQKEREKLGSIARIFANIGLFFVVAGIVPITNLLAGITGSTQQGYFFFAIIVVIIMWIGQTVTLVFVKQPKVTNKQSEHTSFKELKTVIFKNDQLLITAVSMLLFMIGYCITTAFGLYYFKYAYGDENMYSIFAIVLGVSQLIAIISFPKVVSILSRKKLYLIAIILVFFGYILFFFADKNMLLIGISGVLLFIGEAFIQMLMLMFLTDTVEYGQWLLHKRNESITFSLQPFINKMAGAIAGGVVAVTIIISGIKQAENAAQVTSQGLLILKFAMFVLPLFFIITGFILYLKKYKLDEKYYKGIVEDLKNRGDLL